jgi:hypothetical protein
VRRSRSISPRARARAIAWPLLLNAGLVVGRRLAEVPAQDRARIVVLIRRSHGWPGNLAAKERTELRKLLLKLDLMGMGRELLPIALGGGRRRGRRGG